MPGRDANASAFPGLLHQSIRDSQVFAEALDALTTTTAPLGKGQPATWRLLLIKVAASVIVSVAVESWCA